MKPLFSSSIFVSLIFTVAQSQVFWEVRYLPEDGGVGTITPSPNGALFVSQGDALWRTYDLGINWTKLFINNNQYYRDIYVDGSLKVYCAGGFGVFFSKDDGDTWENPYRIESCESVIMNRNGVLFAGAAAGRNGIFRSLDSGNTWTKVLETNGGVVHVVSGSQTLLKSGNDSTFRSTDDGEEWHFVPHPLSVRSAGGFASDSVGNVYMAAGEETGHRSMYKSTDDGLTWERLPMEGAWNTGVGWRALLINSIGHIFLAVDPGGVYRSRDGGQTAEHLYQGADSYLVGSLAILPDGRLLAGARRRLFISVKSTTSSETVPAPTSLSLSRNYPNPAHDLTSVSFSLPEAGAVSLELYNVLGARVQTVIGGDQVPPGEHGATLDVSALPSGVYLLKLRAGNRTVSRMLAVGR